MPNGKSPRGQSCQCTIYHSCLSSGRRGGTNRAVDDGAGAGAIPGGAAQRAGWCSATAVRWDVRDFRSRQRCRCRPGAGPDARPPSVLPVPQRTGDGAHGRRLREDAQPAADAGVHLVDRSGGNQHADRRRWCDDQSPARAAVARRYLRQPQACTGAAAARVIAVAGHLGQRLLQAGLALLGPHLPSGTADFRAARSDARADLTVGDRRRDACAAAGRAGGGLRLSARVVRRTRLDRAARPAAMPPSCAGRRRGPRQPPAGDHRRRRRPLQRCRRRTAPIRRARSVFLSWRPRRARARWSGTIRWRSALRA